MLKRFLRFLFSRHMLMLVLIVGLGVGIWFGGPYVGVGESRPLGDPTVRVVLLVLLLSFLLFWLLHWPVSVVGVAALCLLIWYGSPLLSVGETRPFAEAWVRVAATGTLAGGYGLFLLYTFWQALKANDDLLQKMLHPRLGKPESAAREQLHEVRDIMRRAMTHLRSLSDSSGLRRLVRGSRYLYDLPWYMILGAPGAGKTTAILNSGLRFPLAEQLGAASLAGVSGTRNCVWWFTNEAVLIDTAGRYTTHETNLEVDAAEWKGFLALLRKHRPRAPINGAILTVSVEELAGKSRSELIGLAGTLRERLGELQDELGIRFPVYVMVTKLDLLKGFQDYYQNLNNDGRSQIWGFTLPPPEKGSPRRSAADIQQVYEGELRVLAHRLEQGLSVRLREEYDIERRRRLYCLPGEFSGLFEPLLQLIDLVFFESRYAASQIENRMRGVYFTSAVQTSESLPADKSTLMRRLLELMPTRNAPTRVDSSTLPDKRSYFLHDMLQRVVFPEAFLVQPNTRWEVRFLLIRSLGHLLVLVIAAGAAGAMLTSSVNNENMLREIAVRTAQLGTNLTTVTAQQRDDLVPYVLQQACSLTKDTTVDLDSPPFSYQAGLYSLSGVEAASARVCEQLQERFLLPQVGARLEQRLTLAVRAARDASGKNAEKNMVVYEMLRVYLTLHDRAHLDPDTILEWLNSDIKASPSGHFFAASEQLPDYLWQTLTRLAETRADSPGNSASLKRAPELVQQARAILKNDSREKRLYTRAKRAMQDGTADSEANAVGAFIPVQHLGEQWTHLLYRAGGRSMTEGIPGLFTYEGYHEIFGPKLTTFLPVAVREDAWIMGEEDQTQLGTLLSPQLTRKIRRLYFEEYAQLWKQFVEDVHVVVGTIPESNLEILGALGGTSSPLEQLARAVARETALSAVEKDLTTQLGDLAAKKAKSRVGATGLRFGSIDEVDMVDSRFAALRKVVTGTTAPDSARAPSQADSAEFAAVRALFNEYAIHMQGVLKAETSKTLPPVNDIADRMLAKATQMPPFFSTALMDLAKRGTEQEGQTRERTLAQLIETQLAAPCRRHLENRYPFAPDGRDADPVEVARILGPGGLFESFFETNLAALTNTETSPWTYNTLVANAPDLEPFEAAAAIRDTLFRGAEDKNGTLELEIGIVEVDPRIERLDITIGEAVLQYEHGPSKPLHVLWKGAPGKAVAEMTVRPRHLGVAPLRESGPWALLRLLQRGTLEQAETPGRFWLEFDLDGYKVTLDIAAPNDNPLTSDMLLEFSCPRKPL